MMMYCVRRRSKTETNDLQNVVSKNERPVLRGKCAVSRTTKTLFVSMKKGGDKLN